MAFDEEETSADAFMSTYKWLSPLEPKSQSQQPELIPKYPLQPLYRRHFFFLLVAVLVLLVLLPLLVVLTLELVKFKYKLLIVSQNWHCE
jgi:hypothetical protein